MPSIEYRPDRPKRYRARYWGPDGKLHSRSFARKDDAQRWLTSEEASKLKGTWIDPSRSRQQFDDWADEWWAVWSSNPRRSPTTLEATENRLRRHVRPDVRPPRASGHLGPAGPAVAGQSWRRPSATRA